MSVFIRDIAIKFFFLFPFNVLGFGIGVILAHRMRWEEFVKNWANSYLFIKY